MRIDKSVIDEHYKKINKIYGMENMTRDLKLQKNWNFEKSELYGGVQYLFNLDNGLKVSVIKHFGSYGAKDDKWELAVYEDKEFLSPGFFEGDIVKGWLTDEDVESYLEKIADIEFKAQTKEGSRK